MKAISSPLPSSPKAVISYRGEKVEIILGEGVMVDDLKEAILKSRKNNIMEEDGVTLTSSSSLQIKDLKLMYKGKILQQEKINNDENSTISLDALQVLQKVGGGGGSSSKKTFKVYKIVATGVSKVEVETMDANMKVGVQQMARNVRDDLTSQGQRDMERKRLLGKRMLQRAASTNPMNKVCGGGGVSGATCYCFGKVETLPDLPNRNKAKKILDSLANDPGILACMKKHQFKVGTLGEMYPEGNVGVSDACVMGLNVNAGQRILLRIRTDDMLGFRKIINIRKVLFHELAHNVHSEHNLEFFKLMRQIERDCNDLDWTKGTGLTSMEYDYDSGNVSMYEGGTYRLGGGGGGAVSSVEDGRGSLGGGSNTGTKSTTKTNVRELAARAAMLRMTTTEEEEEEEKMIE